MFDSKDVALIGNSTKIFDHHYPIDDHEVVVRMNRGWALQPEHYKSTGKKVDIVFASTELNFLKSMTSVCNQIVWMTPKHREQAMLQYTDLHFYPIEYWDELTERLGARPSTGCMGADLISRHLGKGKLTLYGFDFFKTPNWWSGSKSLDELSTRIKDREKQAFHPSNPHNGELEKEVILEMLPRHQLSIAPLS